MAKDPICGMDVDERTAQFMTYIGHETFYFCSKVCQESFKVKEGIKEEPKKWWQKILKEPKEKPPKCH